MLGNCRKQILQHFKTELSESTDNENRQGGQEKSNQFREEIAAKRKIKVENNTSQHKKIKSEMKTPITIDPCESDMEYISDDCEKKNE